MFRITLLFFIARLSVAADLTNTAQGLWQSFTATPAPLDIHVEVDRSPNATATPASLRAVLDVGLPVIAGRPGSVLTLWSLTDTLPVQVVRLVSTAPERPGTAAKRAHTAREIVRLRAAVEAHMTALFATTPTTSPILESLVAISLTSLPSPRHQRIIIAITDAREDSRLAKTHCAAPPTPGAWIPRLRQEGLLQSLRGVRVIFANVRTDTVDKPACANVTWYAQRQALWTGVMQAAGATFLWRTGNINATDLDLTKGAH